MNGAVRGQREKCYESLGEREFVVFPTLSLLGEEIQRTSDWLRLPKGRLILVLRRTGRNLFGGFDETDTER